MTQLAKAFGDTLVRLRAEDVRVALVGGLAVSSWVDPRFTRDIDLAVAVDSDREAERLIHRLGSQGFVLVTLIEQLATKRLATARLLPPGQDSDPTTRPQDAQDLRALGSILDDEEVARARVASRLIVERGFHRDRDLDGMLEEYLVRRSAR